MKIDSLFTFELNKFAYLHEKNLICIEIVAAIP